MINNASATKAPPEHMPLKQLVLSLQFGDIPHAKRHRQALARHVVTRCIRHALAHDAEITVRIVGQAEGLALNQSYRAQVHATNVLTFTYGTQPVVADLVLCAPVVAQEAKEQGKTLAAHYAHLLVHGTLHAQGWDHETSLADALAMEAQEVVILRGLGMPNPYA